MNGKLIPKQNKIQSYIPCPFKTVSVCKISGKLHKKIGVTSCYTDFCLVAGTGLEPMTFGL